MLAVKVNGLTDAKGKRTGVVLDLQTYEHLREVEEELADIQAYDALHDRAHSESCRRPVRHPGELPHESRPQGKMKFQVILPHSVQKSGSSAG